jgi:hypothetical protein
MARRRGRIQRGAAGWQELLDRQVASGLNRKAFCAREGVPRSSFETWRRRLASRAVAARFVDVTPPVEAARGWDIELALPGGVVLRMRG